MKILLAFVVLAAAASAAGAQPSRPVLIGTGGGDPCLGPAEVIGLNPRGDNYLSVRAAPNARARELDRLEPLRVVVVCSYTSDDRWVGIVYGRAPEQDCGLGAPVRRPRAYAGPCRSGWAAARYVEMFGD